MFYFYQFINRLSRSAVSVTGPGTGQANQNVRNLHTPLAEL